MSTPMFELVKAGPLGYAVNDNGRTVATVSNHGDIDWLLKSPMQDGPLVRRIVKETHLSYTRGLKITLVPPNPHTELRQLEHELRDGGSTLVLTAHGVSPDGRFASETRAVLRANENLSRYAWEMETRITCRAAEPVSLAWVEFCNVYPRLAGYCFMYAPQKQFDATIMVDRDGVAWRFPHQHLFHYGGKIPKLRFAEGTLAGFFGERTGSPVVVIHRSSLPPDWGICDMYYDLHCGGRPTAPLPPGTQLTFAYTVKYISAEEAEKIAATARPVPLDPEDFATHDYPRLELGLNTFSSNVRIDALDDASGFRPRPPQKVWDRDTGHRTKGSLRLTNDQPEQTVWGCEPPTNIPPETRLRISAMVKVQGVTGRGATIRVRYHTFEWLPQPHVLWAKDLETVPVTGTTDGWVRVETPELVVPKEQADYLIALEVILDGQGVAWFTDVDVDLQPTPQAVPQLEAGQGKEKKGKAGSVSKNTKARKSAPAGATV